MDSKYKSSRGVVYLGHVPHGFYEQEMKSFFSQFGKVTNINIPRSTRTRRYRGYAFVEFLYPEVAKVVAETMNNYLMFKKVLKAKYIPPEEQKPLCFRFPKVKTPLTLRRQKYLRKQSQHHLSKNEVKKETHRLEKSLNKKIKKLKKLGIDYEFQVLFLLIH
ncbi:hypothetical protein PGB90_007987 [Kerria lacca]